MQAPQVSALHGGEATWGCFHWGVFDGYSAATAPDMSILNTHARTHTRRTKEEMYHTTGPKGSTSILTSIM